MIRENELIYGLTEKEAGRRNETFGYNELEEKKKTSAIALFLSQFNDFIIWVLIGATVISGIMGQKADAITIMIIVIINAILGFAQEYKTEKSLEALKSLSAPTCKVIRDGGVKVINTRYVTVGDVVILEAGDKVPADGELIDGMNIVVDESILSGESVGVNKGVTDKNKKIYMGTTVLKGKGLVKVNYIGMDTEMGKIANMIQEIEAERSPLKEKLDSLGEILVIMCVVICAVVTILGIIRGNNVAEMFLLGVSLAVAAIPEGLAAIVTVALALGVNRMIKRNALVRKLPAVETLGCTSIICSDKTGTLTQNKMTVKEVYTSGKGMLLDKGKLCTNEILKKIFVLCNDTNYDFNASNLDKGLNGDPTETALVTMFFDDLQKLKLYLSQYQRVYEIPFDSNRKMMSVIVKDKGREICLVKGAPEKLIERCSHILENGRVTTFEPSKKKKVMEDIDKMSNKALRCIGAAYKDTNITKGSSLERNLIFVGVAGSIDPPRIEAKDSVLKCRLAGVTPVMITGDHKNTAYAIAEELGICKDQSQVITGDEIESISDKELREKVKKIRVFARVSPNHKLRIVQAFKKNGNIVAMTGDGVNDAPAIKEADIGVAMGISGTDVTKEASSMILMDDNFKTIVSAVEEGRVIYDNIRKFIRYLLSCNLGEVLTMFLASLFYLPTPLAPIQILFVNLATDGLPAIALGVDPPDADIMSQRPRQRNESIFARGLTEKILVRGTLIGLCTLFAFMAGIYFDLGMTTARTMALSTLVLSQLIHVFECRSERHSIFKIKLFTNPYLVGAVAISLIMLLCAIYMPFFRAIFHTSALQLSQWGIVVFFSGIIALINSVYLYIQDRRRDR
ncbi:calcium-translocating P-type ATPase, PMCA-type [Inconstantimicrobium mannanitabidum]|uniref:Calcium-translocating P-type ATPase, PMCA-type n=1 Tax=Inconstantimicrobium mannanitabidum TaxID=1604901 RepID=A0ACB5R938_9CLOT|nr:calcium-translocating P-type ATPase, PMCA-type [Clostridium sp. TW13]GKX65540.1 calcium-translocating P-type ATPase, PMCA-type [Clostridium sp. TW13]